MIKLHLCCGKRNFGEDWIHIDGEMFPHVKYQSVGNLKQFKSESVGLIYCSHGIAYFDRAEIIPVLYEWLRVLRPGGVLRLATPDFAVMAALYQLGTIQLQQILGPLYGKMSESVIYHKTVYDFKSLESLLVSCGFSNVRRYDHTKTDHAHHDDHSAAYLNGTLISLNVECDA